MDDEENFEDEEGLPGSKERSEDGQNDVRCLQKNGFWHIKRGVLTTIPHPAISMHHRSSSTT